MASAKKVSKKRGRQIAQQKAEKERQENGNCINGQVCGCGKKAAMENRKERNIADKRGKRRK